MCDALSKCVAHMCNLISDNLEVRQEDRGLLKRSARCLLEGVPDNWQGVETTDIEMLFEVIEQIRQHNTVVADVLAQVTNDFEYDEILRVIQEVK